MQSLRVTLVTLVALGLGVANAYPSVDQPQAPATQNDKEKYSEENGRKFAAHLNKEIEKRSNLVALASWAYASNITEENLQNKIKISLEVARYQKEAWKEVVKFPWNTFSDPDLRRQFSKMAVLGIAALDDAKFEKFDVLKSGMQDIYSSAKICDFNDKNNCNLNLEPELTYLLAKSRNPDELRHIWVEFRKKAGDKVREQFTEYVSLINEAARLNNFTDASEEWLKDFEAPDFREQIFNLWKDLRPLYEQLHAYVRRKLREQYGENIVSRNGPIPAHLLGNMWAQTWGNIYDIVKPFPNKDTVDVSETMVKQGYTPEKMFKLAESFFTSLNLSAMPDTFWTRSILKKPEDRKLVCHASAWDFYDRKDFRIKQCTAVNMENLLVAHHEMGHVEYFMQYKDQPLVYQAGSNPGFHEAVGDTISLSVSTPNHLRKIGLLPEDSKDDPETEINHLLHVALDKVAFFPFGFLMDLWRWEVLQGRTKEPNYNCEWWKWRHTIQGIEPPVNRTEDNFDPGSKYHIIASVSYIEYFVSHVVQFQFHRALCEKAGQFDPANPERLPLHKCDIYQSTEAGNAFGKMLQLGSSRPWPDAMEILTGQRKMDATAVLQYFRPLQKWLEEENAKTKEHIGWGAPTKVCRSSRASQGETAPASPSA